MVTIRIQRTAAILSQQFSLLLYGHMGQHKAKLLQIIIKAGSDYHYGNFTGS